jgi:hypothetical protein
VIEFVPGKHNVADVLTKALPGPKHKWCREKLGVVKLVKGRDGGYMDERE